MLNEFERAVMNQNYSSSPLYSFNLNYIAIYFAGLVKLISITNGNLVKILAFDKDIFSIIESDLSLYILFNDPDFPYYIKIQSMNPDFQAKELKKENIF